MRGQTAIEVVAGQPKKSTLKKPAKSGKAIPGGDFRAWDKFDVDKTLEDMELQEQKEEQAAQRKKMAEERKKQQQASKRKQAFQQQVRVRVRVCVCVCVCPICSLSLLWLTRRMRVCFYSVHA